MKKLTDDAAESASTASVASPDGIRSSGTVSIARVLVMIFGGVIVVALIIVLGIGFWTGRQNTLDHLTHQAEMNLSFADSYISHLLDPVAGQLLYLRDSIAHDPEIVTDSERTVDILRGALAATPQIHSIAFVDSEFQHIKIERGGDRGVSAMMEDGSKNPAVRAIVNTAKIETKLTWDEPEGTKNQSLALLPLRMPLQSNNRFIGVLVARVSLEKLSELLADLKFQSGTVAFITDANHQVLAHPKLSSKASEPFRDKPLPMAVTFVDPVLEAMHVSQRHQHSATKHFEGQWQLTDVNGEPYLFMHRKISDYGEKAWTLSSYYHAFDFAQDMRRLIWAAFAGMAVLIVAVAAAVILGQRISLPIQNLEGAARLIGNFDIASVSRLPGSRFQEVNEAARAFNVMLNGLRWFETYVPKALVEQLMKHDDGSGLASTEREVTVLFTDIVGFTEFSETIPAAEIAEFLNDHFELVAECISATGGTVDKYMGDGMMAFWGAPEWQPDHAERACQAAKSIATVLREDNRKRAQAGRPLVFMRIGIHTGNVVVGNIGAVGRMNYTIVGDTVNTASRLEQMCKEVSEKSPDIMALISGTTAAALASGVALVDLGRHRLRGRQGCVAVFRLI